MESNSSETDGLLRRARDEKEALGQLLMRYAGRLRTMVGLHLDRRLAGRIDIADVLQETFLDATRCFPRYRERPSCSFYVWLRGIAARRLVDIHRHHLGVQGRDPRREISLNAGSLPEATSEAFAARLLDAGPTPSEEAMDAERAARVAAALEELDPIDREVLALRHFEQLSNGEAAQVLEIEESAASKRHLRALLRVKEALKTV